MRRLDPRALGPLLAGAALVASCNQTTIQTPIRVFDAPSDVALACVHFNPATRKFDTRSFGDCDPNIAATLTRDGTVLPSGFVPPAGPGTITPFEIALVTQSARGEVTLVDTNQYKILDLDRRTPSFGFVPVGRNPQHIRTSHDGCNAVTANADSCDLSTIDVPTLLNGSLQSTIPQFDMAPPIDTSNAVKRIHITVPTGTSDRPSARVLNARPSWIEMAPESKEAGVGLCSADASQYKAWVALPACQLVVKVNLEAGHEAGGNVEAALQVTKSGARVVPKAELGSLSCASECTGERLPDLGAGPVDAGPVDAGAAVDASAAVPDAGAASDMGPPRLPDTQAYPGAIAVDTENGLLIVGDLNGETVWVTPLDVRRKSPSEPISGSGDLGKPVGVPLESGAAGVSTVRVAPRSLAGKYLYVIARDNTVRVVDLDRLTECETNPDPRWMGPPYNFQGPPDGPDAKPQARALGCFPLSDPNRPPRSPLTRSPGISLGGNAVPRDIAFVHVDQPPPFLDNNLVPPEAAPGLLVGDFAWIVSSDGRVVAVTIYDDCPQPNTQLSTAVAPNYSPACSKDLDHYKAVVQEIGYLPGHPQPMLLDRLSHRIRDGHPRFVIPRVFSDQTGMPRMLDETQPFNVVVGSVNGEVVDAGGAQQTPGLFIEKVPAALVGQTGGADRRAIRFVDPDHARNESWTLAWEGVLPGSERTLGQPLINNGAAMMLDNGGAYCNRGVLAGDKLELSGCTVDSDCDYTQRCVHDVSAPPDVTQGLCLTLDDKRTNDYWSTTCGSLLRAHRLYRVTRARQQTGAVAGVPLPRNGKAGVTDVLDLAEIYEPEYSVETQTCTPPNATEADPCRNVTVTISDANGLPVPLPTTCQRDWDGQNRCLRSCTLPDPAKPNAPSDIRCGAGYQCAQSTQGNARCMRAPINANLWSACFPELQDYQVHAGEAFVVFGSTSGFLNVTDVSSDGDCQVPSLTPPSPRNQRTRLYQARIPLVPQVACDLDLNDPPPASRSDGGPLASIDTRAHPDEPNVCVVQSTTLGMQKVVHFENTQFNIAVTLPGRIATFTTPGMTDKPVLVPQVPPSLTAVEFTVTGGGGVLASEIGVDTVAQLPRAVAVGADQQSIYVVDEGRAQAASGLRGQLVRIFSASQTNDIRFIIR